MGIAAYGEDQQIQAISHQGRANRCSEFQSQGFFMQHPLSEAPSHIQRELKVKLRHLHQPQQRQYGMGSNAIPQTEKSQVSYSSLFKGAEHAVLIGLQWTSGCSALLRSRPLNFIGKNQYLKLHLENIKQPLKLLGVRISCVHSKTLHLTIKLLHSS